MSLTQLSSKPADEVQRPNKKLAIAMLNLTLQRSDSIETVLPFVEQAMHAGDECCIRNIDYLGLIHAAALELLAKSGSLMSATSGQVVRSKPGFRLLAIDESGAARALTA